MSKYSGAALVEFAKAARRNGVKYLFGGNYETLTLARLDQLRSQYPANITDSRYEAAKKNYIGKTVADCSGLIYGYTKDGTRRTTWQLWDKAARRVPLDKNNTAAIPIGAVLYRDGHVGIYQGGGKTVEAQGFDYGLTERDVKNTAFTHYLLFDDFDYGHLPATAGSSSGWWKWLLAGVAVVGIIKFVTSKK